MALPLRPRNIQGDRINIQQVDTETLIYDERCHRAWCLNRSAACIWNLCDGQNTIREITAKAAIDLGPWAGEEFVLLTLVELRQANLIDADSVEGLPHAISRRQMISRAGLAAAALLPVIAALTAPPASAQNGSVGTGDAKRLRLARGLYILQNSPPPKRPFQR